MDELEFSEDRTDESQRDLPYDGELERNHQKHKNETCIWSEHTFTAVESISDDFSNMMLSEVPKPQDWHTPDEIPGSEENVFPNKVSPDTLIGEKLEADFCMGLFHIPDDNKKYSNSHISEVLLRHLSNEELLNACHFIDGETIPEISFIESFDENRVIKNVTSHRSENLLPKQKNTGDSDQKLLNSEEENCDSSPRDGFTLEENKFDLKPSEEPEVHTEGKQNLLTENGCTKRFKKTQMGQMSQKRTVERTHSSHEFKYGQGQVHYRLPDFSKIAPKVKIPRRNCANKSTPVVKQTTSSPNLIGESGILPDVLGAKTNLDFIEKQSEEEIKKNAEFLQQLQLLTKHAEAQNLTDFLRFTTKVEPSLRVSKGSHTAEEPFPNPSNLHTTKGEKMGQKLKEQTDHLRTKVQAFSKRITWESLPFEEYSLVLKQLQSDLDMLEQNYLATKEKHRGLQLQNYRLQSVSVGVFDPGRKLEGEIFQIEMQLEDIKEKMDQDMRSFSPSSPVAHPIGSSLSLGDSVSVSCSPALESTREESLTGHTERAELETNNQKEKGESESNENEIIPAKSEDCCFPDDVYELYPQIYLGLPQRVTAISEDFLESNPGETNEPMENSSDAMQCFPLEAEDGSGRVKALKQCMLNQDCASAQGALKRNPKKELKVGHRKPKSRGFPILIQEKAMNLDLADDAFDADSGDNLFPDSFTGPQRDEFTDSRLKMHETQNSGFEELPRACSQRKRIGFPKTYAKMPRDQCEPIVSGRPNLRTPKMRSTEGCNPILFSPPCSSQMSSGSSFKCRRRSTKKSNSKILNSALDRALQTAVGLKKTTERMIREVAEDLDKFQNQKSQEQF
ncbi:protein AKNAD1 isoform X3 [Ornithorhynchus anatinus]|uniref:protein AKNAD1 isoform X3 n=1 Tax=Ornithorhynchus anatinus TaxID=9258 RepID=UPI0019D41D47|nr:protein AKNAD1 isoform X3 [Ornithorhynchus anatinus]